MRSTYYWLGAAVEFYKLLGDKKMSLVSRFKDEVSDLLKEGELLQKSLLIEQHGATKTAKLYGLSEAAFEADKAPNFTSKYQSWYTRSLSVLKNVIPDRLADFRAHYEAPKSRKDLTYGNYRIHDALLGIKVTRGDYGEVVVGKSAAIPHFQQQFAILLSAWDRFESSVFDIRRLLQADLFDSEIASARALLKSGFLRAAGAVAGVVLEKHLRQVCEDREFKIAKKYPTIADYNDRLKLEGILEMPDWRRIGFLGDLRNLCDHDKQKEPTVEQLEDLLSGVEKVLKTVF
jgi:hypothetical protein